MRGTPVTTPKTKKGYPLTQSAALEIFLILLIPLLIAAVHVYRLGVTAITKYEANQLKTMMARSAETGTDLIYMEGRKAEEEGHYLDLAEAIEEIDAIDFVSIADQKDNGSGIDKSAVGLEQANLQFWYVVVSEDDKILLVENTAGSSRELTEDDDMLMKCRKAAEDTKAVQWEDKGSYFCMFLQPLNCPLIYADTPLLHNASGANIGMLVKCDLSFIEDSVKGRALLYVIILYGALLIIITAMCLSVHRSLRVLRDMSVMMRKYRLRQNPVMDELKSSLSVIRRRARDNELKDLTESFYVMTVNLIDYQDTVESIKNQYEPFVPEALLGLFNKEDLLDIKPGDTAEISGAWLQVRFESSETADADTLCKKADNNPLCAEVCDIIKDKGGVVVHIAQSGLEAIFPVNGSSADDAFEAEHAGEDASELIQSLKKDKTGARAIVTGLRHGVFCLTVIGSEKRMAIRLTEKGSCNA